MSKMILAGALVASAMLALPLAANADSGHGVSTPRPSSLTGAWTALMAARDAIASDVEAGALAKIHAKAGPLPKLVAALLEQSGDLDAGKRTRVEGAAKQVARVADALHVAADRGDANRTRKELSRLDGLLELIRAQYSAGTLDADTQRHEGHSAAPAPPRQLPRAS